MKKMFMKTGKKPGRDSVRSKKGFTLVELCIVIGLLAIVSMMVFSFLPLLFKRSNEVISKKAITEDVRMIESTINNFILHYDNEDYKIECYNNAICSFGYYDNGLPNFTSPIAQLTFDSTTKEMKCTTQADPDNPTVYSLANITSISFSQVAQHGDETTETAPADSSEAGHNNEKTNIMILCNISYTVSDSKSAKTMTLSFVTHAQGSVVIREV